MPAALLTACLLGLWSSPWGYVAMGALFQFSPMASLFLLPPLLLGQGYLGWRYLVPLSGSTARSRLLAEVPAWAAILFFLYVVSNFTLMTLFERLGLFSTIHLICVGLGLLSLPLGTSKLEQRLRRLPNGVTAAVAVAILLVELVLMIVCLLKAPAFPG